jgi:predicted DCC family thiol-disulfide oxidoreductase YuxK
MAAPVSSPICAPPKQLYEHSRRSSSLNPFSITGTDLPPNLLLMVKVIAICFLLSGQWAELPVHFLPFVSLLDRIGSPQTFRHVLQLLFAGASVALLLNRRVRTCCIVLGLVILVAMFSSRTYYGNNRLFTGLIFFLTGLYEPGHSPWMVRLQVSLVYLGAGLNKITDPDWRSGQFFQHWIISIHHQNLYAHVAALFPPMMLSRAMGCITFTTELFLAVALLTRWYRYAIWVGICFHTALLVLTGRTFGMFYYAMLASYLAFVCWPKEPLTVLYDAACGFCSRTQLRLRKLDFDNTFRWLPFQDSKLNYLTNEEKLRKRLHLVYKDRLYDGFSAFRMVTLYNTVWYFVVAVCLSLPEPHGVHYRRWIALMLLALFSPPFIPVGQFFYDMVARNRHCLGAGGPEGPCAANVRGQVFDDHRRDPA